MESLGDALRSKVIVQDEALKTGFTQLPNYILRDKNLSAWARLAYAVLLSYAWQDDSCFPGQARMAEDLGCSERYLRSALAELKDNNYIDWKHRGLNKPNIYYILSLQERWEKHQKGRSNR